jgi:leucyl aminopeptidase (aminopeptidase T)
MKELKEAAHVALTDCADVKQGENVVIVTDAPLRNRGLAFWETARDMGADAIFCEIIPRKTNGEEPPKAVTALLRDCDVFMIPTSKSLSHTDARREASAAGARGATLPNITEDTMKRTLRADYPEIEERTRRIANILKGAREARVITELGTDITMSLEGREWEEDTGIVRKPGTFTNLPAGEAYIAPMEGTAKGRIVADGSCAGIGVIITPITIDVAAGLATEISGGEEAATLKKLIAPFGDDGRNIAELGIGTNDKAQLVGSTLEDEKVMGTVHIALGDNKSMGGNISVASHLDLIIKAPTLVVDGKEIIKAGKWTV